MSVYQGDQCFHFFQLKNISFCGCHPQHNKWVGLLHRFLHSISRFNSKWSLPFLSNADHSTAGILVSSPSTLTNSVLPVMWWCQRQHHILWPYLWGKTYCIVCSNHFYSVVYIISDFYFWSILKHTLSTLPSSEYLQFMLLYASTPLHRGKPYLMYSPSLLLKLNNDIHLKAKLICYFKIVYTKCAISLIAGKLLCLLHKVTGRNF